MAKWNFLGGKQKANTATMSGWKQARIRNRRGDSACHFKTPSDLFRDRGAPSESDKIICACVQLGGAKSGKVDKHSRSSD